MSDNNQHQVPKSLTGILFLGLLLRLAFVGYHYFSGYDFRFDAQYYYQLALNMKEGVFSLFHPLNIPETTRMPGYPFLVYLLAPTMLLILQAVLSTLKLFLIYRIIRSFGVPEKLALIFIGILTFEPIDVLLSGSLLTESLFSFLIWLCLYFLLFCKQNNLKIILSVTALTVMAYLRTNGFVFSVVVLLLFYSFVERNIRSLGLSLFLLCFFISPWIIRNYRLFGEFKISNSSTVVSAFYQTSEVLGENDEYPDYRKMATEINWENNEEVRKYYQLLNQDNIRVIKEYPISYAIHFSEKFIRNVLSPGTGHVRWYFKASTPMQQLLVAACYFYLLVFGVIMASLLFQVKKLNKLSMFFLLAGVLYIASCSISAVDARFKHPVMVMLMTPALLTFSQTKKSQFNN
jgi:hypothetical protein